MGGIGELNQSALHEQLKEFYRGEDGEVEVAVGSYVVDVRRGEELIEVQTSRLGKLRTKLATLLADHRVRLVHPIAARTLLIRVDQTGNALSRRRSPKRGRLEDAFWEIDDIATLLPHPNLTLDIALVEITEYRRDDGKGSWRRRGVSVVGRELQSVVSRNSFRTKEDFGALLPESLGDELTNSDVCAACGLSAQVAQSMTRALRKIGALEKAGRRGREILYRRV